MLTALRLSGMPSTRALLAEARVGTLGHAELLQVPCEIEPGFSLLHKRRNYRRRRPSGQEKDRQKTRQLACGQCSQGGGAPRSSGERRSLDSPTNC